MNAEAKRELLIEFLDDDLPEQATREIMALDVASTFCRGSYMVYHGAGEWTMDGGFSGEDLKVIAAVTDIYMRYNYRP